MKKLLTTLIIISALPLLLNSQTDDLKEAFLEAESYFLFEEYSEAIISYLKIHRAEPDNDNINYKIGVCFLNDPYQKEKSIRYLEEATQNINPNYKENNFKEKSAPLEAFFYLGNAYLVNNQIEKALENYQHFREILDEKIYDVELVEEQIKVCNTATNLMKVPVDYEIENLPSVINTRFTDKNPIISGNGKRMIFVSELRFYDAAYFAEKVDGVWQPPRNIVPDLGVDGDVYPTYLSYDGTEMIIYRNDDFIGNLYYSKYVDGRWTAMTELEGNINTKYWESHGSMSKDGKTLYFTSNRKGGYGGLDIYESKRKADGTWENPVNLGETINTRYNEETPFLTENGQYLYFSSYGHFNMGGYDVFYSRKKSDGQWDTPINMGYPINTTDDDLFYYPVNNGLNAYFSIIPEEGQGLHDICYLDIYSDNNPRMYMVTGYLNKDKDALTINDGVNILLIDGVTGDTVDMTYPDLSSQKFTVEAPRGIYNLIVKSNTFDEVHRKLEIDKESDKTGITLDNELALVIKADPLPKLLTGEENKINLEDSILQAASGETLEIKMKLEKDATLIANVYLDSIQTASDTFFIDKRRFTYEMMPQTGMNRVELFLTDENGDISKQTILIHAEAKDVAKPDTETQSVLTTTEDPTSSEDLPAAIESDSIDGSSDPSAGTYLSKVETKNIIATTENDAAQLLTLLLESSDGALLEYLQELNLDAAGINTAKELIAHLLQVAEEKEFTANDLSNSILKIIDKESVDSEISKPDSESDIKESKGSPSILIIGGGLVFVGFGFYFLFLLWKRRTKEEEKEKR